MSNPSTNELSNVVENSAPEVAEGLEKHQVSCLMVTQERVPFVKRSIGLFQAQTYRNRELVVVNAVEDGTEEYIRSLGDGRIKYVRPDRSGLKLGDLRNIAVTAASGQYVMQWDDDDWYHPDRIKIQLTALQYIGAEVCFLSRLTLAWPAKGLFHYSKMRHWENSMLALRQRLSPYPPLTHGEDAAQVRDLLARGVSVCCVDNPDLYIYVVHGRNTFGEDHFVRNIFNESTVRLSAGQAAEVSRKLTLH